MGLCTVHCGHTVCLEGLRESDTEAEIQIKSSRMSRTLSAKERKVFQAEGTVQKQGQWSIHEIE